MKLVKGINHVAVITADLERFVAFYRGVFAMDVVFEETTPAFRHAILRAGPDSWLHPATLAGNAHGTALPAIFERGHLDHLALTSPSPEAFAIARRRLVERGASDGSVESLGAFQCLWFQDPDERCRSTSQDARQRHGGPAHAGRTARDAVVPGRVDRGRGCLRGSAWRRSRRAHRAACSTARASRTPRRRSRSCNTCGAGPNGSTRNRAR